MSFITVHDFHESAREKLTHTAYDYYAGGAADEITLRENRAQYDRIALLNRVLVDVGTRDLSTTVLGQPVSMPVLIPPMAFQKLADPTGELSTTRAAGAAGTIMILSTMSTFTIEEVMAVATGPVWFQLYVYRDREVTRSLIKRAEKAGCSALVITVDLPVTGQRERDAQNRFQLPVGLTLKNLEQEYMRRFPHDIAGSGLQSYTQQLLDPSLTWKDIDWFRSITKLPIVLKGIMRPDDAVKAIDSGVSAVIVSNHGGRQLDTAAATIRALPKVVEAVAGRIEIFVDGGIRRGTDVIKAIALGARAVLIGRPILWGLAVNGESGVNQVLTIVRNELDLAMALCGCPTVSHITFDLIA